MAVRAAHEEGLDDHAASDIAIIATEAATNLIKHATRGAVYISTLSALGAPGVEIIALDRGPGLSDVHRCLMDGYSTAGTAGTGLGAITRISSEFDVYSQSEKGTVLAARLYAKAPTGSSGQNHIQVGAVCVPIKGEDACGDAWYARREGDITTLMLADGLGHGMMAATAASAAVAAFQRAPAMLPSDTVLRLHHALKGTRGAAVAVAEMNAQQRIVRFSGVGNVVGVIIGGDKPQSMVSHNGTAGHEVQRVQGFEYPLPRTGVVILHSDGLNTRWTPDAYPGLLLRHPSVIAGVLYRDASRGRDDSCVVVARIPFA